MDDGAQAFVHTLLIEFKVYHDNRSLCRLRVFRPEYICRFESSVCIVESKRLTSNDFLPSICQGLCF